jgi:hypothetical protein
MAEVIKMLNIWAVECEENPKIFKKKCVFKKNLETQE